MPGPMCRKDDSPEEGLHAPPKLSKVFRPADCRAVMLLVICSIFSWCAYAVYYSPRYTLRQQFHLAPPVEAVWRTIKPGTVDGLFWTPCYEDSGLQCARLAVPLDYAHPNGESAIIALVKRSARIPRTDPRYKGPILVNPGGPGGSGVSFVAIISGLLQASLGDEFDIIGFDPRGVARTLPQVLVFPDASERTSWYLKASEIPLWNTSIDAIPRMYAKSKILGSLADARVKHAASHVSTALVARDMLSITRALGREKLQYWGFSYGTVLGVTFSAMFPDKVERMVLDGVADADDYYSLSWKKNLLDTDKSLYLILQACVDAGPERCILYESTAQKIHDRLTSILETLKRSPIAASTGCGPHDYGIVDYKMVKSCLLMFLYSSYSPGAAERLAFALRALEIGEARPFWNLIRPLQQGLACTCPSEAPTLQTLEAQQAIHCGDGVPLKDTIDDISKLFYELRQQSEFADVWPYRVMCNGWTIRAVERFTGPFVGNTSHPLLFIGNTADPVTPLLNAHTMSKGFGSSIVLTQTSAGHTALAATSYCTARAIRYYFREGVLPAEGTICNIENRLFRGVQKDIYENHSSEELTLMRAWSELSEMFPVARQRMLL